ncbi:MAG: zinc-ribbon domain-containing protein [Clostridium sp.]|nr:zinc-ribbon domain-containing protein [Clostridium sp.]
MKCNHCGEELAPNAKFCHNCAEPVIKSNPISEKAETTIILGSTFGFGIATGIFVWFLLLITDSANKWLLPLLLSFVGGAIGLLSSSFFVSTKQGKRRVNINNQYNADKTSICPMCGSHSVTIYRKGYDWNGAFWGNMFKIKGSRYLAGMDSNETMCKCDHCGHTWNTHYDYRIERQRRK